MVYLRLGQAPRAVTLYDAMIALHVNDVRMGPLLNGRCWSRALAGIDLDKALDDCNRALKLTGRAPDVLDSHALILFRKHDFSAALGEYDAVLAGGSRHAWSLYMRGLTHLALGQEEAGQADRKAAEQVESDVGTLARRYGLTQ